MFEDDPDDAKDRNSELPATSSPVVPAPEDFGGADPRLQELLAALAAARGIVIRRSTPDIKAIVSEVLSLKEVTEVTVVKDGIEVTAKKGGSDGGVPTWFPIAGVIFTAITMLSLFALVTGLAQAVQKNIFFNVWVAFCVAASASFLGGSAAAKGSLPIPAQWGDKPVNFSVWGGVAVFFVTLLLMWSLNG